MSKHDEGLYMPQLWLDAGSFQKKRCRMLQMWGAKNGIDKNDLWKVRIL